MFKSFFPRPKLFVFSAIIWSAILIIFWYSQGENLGKSIGFKLLDEKTVIGLGHFVTPEFLWFDVYYLLGTLAFYFAWRFYSPHNWQNWSILGSALLIYLSYASVQVSVVVNAWYGPFYDDIQKALSGNSEVEAETLYRHFIVFGSIAFPYVAFMIGNRFFTSHFIFRWRSTMNDYYIGQWKNLRTVEGASQRVQEDTMRFAAIMEGLGVSLVDSLMTLIAFLPVLAALSVHVETMPILGAIPYPLVVLSIAWALFGTLLLLVAGIRLPGLEFKNQRVEAAFRKELVLGEESETRAEPIKLKELFDAYKVYRFSEKYNTITSIYFVIRLSLFALIKKIDMYR